MTLFLNRTKLKGLTLAHLKSFQSLASLSLDDSELTDEGLKALAGASNLQFLSVSRVPLSAKGLQALKNIPSLQQLNLTGCGLLDEEYNDFKSQTPGLKIIRQ